MTPIKDSILDWCKDINAPKTYDLMKTIINDAR